MAVIITAVTTTNDRCRNLAPFSVTPAARAALANNGWLPPKDDPATPGSAVAPAPGGKVCKITGCTTSHNLVKGMCTKHYQRFLKYGDPNIVHSPGKKASPATEKALRPKAPAQVAPKAPAPPKPKPAPRPSALKTRAKTIDETNTFPTFTPRPMPPEYGKPAPAPKPATAAKTCLVNDCTEPHASYGFCTAHLEEWQTTGKAPGAQPMRVVTEAEIRDAYNERQRQGYEAERRRRNISTTNPTGDAA